jgi:hypothetical protein
MARHIESEYSDAIKMEELNSELSTDDEVAELKRRITALKRGKGVKKGKTEPVIKKEQVG